MSFHAESVSPPGNYADGAVFLTGGNAPVVNARVSQLTVLNPHMVGEVNNGDSIEIQHRGTTNGVLNIDMTRLDLRDPASANIKILEGGQSHQRRLQPVRVRFGARQRQSCRQPRRTDLHVSGRPCSYCSCKLGLHTFLRSLVRNSRGRALPSTDSRYIPMIVSKREVRAIVCAAIVAAEFVCAEDAHAQSSSLSIEPLHVGDCQVVVQVTNPRAGDQVGVVVELTESREQTVIAGRTELTFALSEPLREGFRVHTRLNGVAGRDEMVPAGGAIPKGQCEAPAESTDSNDPFYASVYLGKVIDNFAPDRVGDYRNPDKGTKQKSQWIAGFDFDYRIYGKSDSRWRVWLEGETMHGVRTADIDCEGPRDAQGNIDASKIPPVCNKDATFADRVRYILENASSVEAFVQPRLEFFQVQKDTESAAWLYTSARIGFIGLKEAPKVYRSMNVALGLTADRGNFEQSYFEVGWGKNELLSPRWNRIQVDGLLSFSLEKLPLVRDNGRLFVEMSVDNDLHDGPDSVRTFFGVDVDLGKAVGR